MPLILPGNVGSATAATGFNVANSARFDDDPATYLSHTHGAVTSTRKNTFSVWVKRGNLLGSYQYIISTKNGTSTDRDGIAFSGSDQIDIRYGAGSSSPIRLTTNRVFRDVSAWMHIVVAVDTTQGTAANRIKLYVNGVQETSFATSNYMDQNYDFALNAKTDQATGIGVDGRLNASYFVGYMSEFVAIDNQQLAPTDFGEFDSDSGIWKPIDPSGLTFGNAGFYMKFETAAELGTDVSGNSNTFSESGFTAVEQSIDTCTNNFATMNSLLLSVASLNFTQGNLTNNGNSSSTWRTMYSTIGASAGKWYFEVRINKTKSSDPNNFIIGIQDAEQMFQAADTAEISSTSRGYGYRGNGGNKVNNTTGTGSSFGDAYGTAGDIVGCAVDLDNHKIYFRKGGTFQASGDPTTGSTGTGSAFNLTTGITYMFGISSYYDDDRHSFNFGSPPYSESGGNSDGEGFGNFAGSVPSGYFALCTKNLAEYG